MRKLALKCLTLLIILSNPIYADFQEALNATCIIIGEEKEECQAMSTGVVFKETEKLYYILCSGHGIQNCEKPKVTFNTNGIFSKPIESKIELVVFEKKLNENDYAIISIPKTIKIKPIPLAEDRITFGTHYTCCFHNNTIAVGKCRLYSIGDHFFRIVPYPYPGTSGSPVFDKDFTKVYGIHLLSSGLCVYTDYILENEYFSK